jgi:hypothetical protein
LASLYPLNQEEGLEDGNQESTCLSNKDPKWLHWNLKLENCIFCLLFCWSREEVPQSAMAFVSNHKRFLSPWAESWNDRVCFLLHWALENIGGNPQAFNLFSWAFQRAVGRQVPGQGASTRDLLHLSFYNRVSEAGDLFKNKVLLLK